MILLTELSRRRIRSINKFIRVSVNEVVVVVRVDRDKGHIDLSKHRVSSEDISKCEERFVRGKTVGFSFSTKFIIECLMHIREVFFVIQQIVFVIEHG